MTGHPLPSATPRIRPTTHPSSVRRCVTASVRHCVGAAPDREGRRRLEVRTARGCEEMERDETGRFSVALVPRGHFQPVLQGNDGAPAVGTGLRRAVVTPAPTL